MVAHLSASVIKATHQALTPACKRYLLECLYQHSEELKSDSFILRKRAKQARLTGVVFKVEDGMQPDFAAFQAKSGAKSGDVNR